MYFYDLYSVLVKLFNGCGSLVKWFFEPMDFGAFQIAPIYFLSAGTLILYLTVAVAKWIIT